PRPCCVPSTPVLSIGELFAHNIHSDDLPFFLRELLLPGRYAAKAVGHAIEHEFGRVPGRIQVRRLARVGRLPVTEFTDLVKTLADLEVFGNPADLKTHRDTAQHTVSLHRNTQVGRYRPRVCQNSAEMRALAI